MKEAFTYLLVFLSLPLVLWLVRAVSDLPTSILPPPELVAELLWEERASLLGHTLETMKIALLGYALANIITLSLSISFLYVKRLEDFVTPWTVVIKNIPYVTLAGILIVTMG